MKKPFLIAICIGFAICAAIAAVFQLQQQKQFSHIISANTAEIAGLKAEISLLKEENARLKEAPKGFYQKLGRGQDVGILIVGDSIALGNGLSSTGQAWPELLKGYIEDKYHVACGLTNISMGGNTSYAGYVREMLLKSDERFDLAIICYGENDGSDTLSLEYEAIIRGIRKRPDRCAIISVLESSQKKYTQKIRTIEEVAKHYDIPVADTIRAFSESGIPYEELTVDKKHPNESGHKLYFEALKEIIDANAEAYQPFNEIDVTPINGAVSEYDSFYHIPAEAFDDKGSGILEVPVNGNMEGFPGIYHTFYPGEGKLSVYGDGNLYGEISLDWPYEFQEDYIYKLGEEKLRAFKSIRLEFSPQELQKGFKGLVFTGITEIGG